MVDFEPNENLGLVEFHGLWDWSVSVWLWKRECTAGTRESVGGELADRWAYADEWLYSSWVRCIQLGNEL
jgi:hypothetical protein